MSKTNWEYRLVALPTFDSPQPDENGSLSISLLVPEGKAGWEAVGMVSLDSGRAGVLMKRPLARVQSGGRM